MNRSRLMYAQSAFGFNFFCAFIHSARKFFDIYRLKIYYQILSIFLGRQKKFVGAQ